MVARGISFYAGGFPNEFTMAKQMKEGVDDVFSAWFYLYLAGIIALTVLGAIVQYKHNADKPKTNY